MDLRYAVDFVKKLISIPSPTGCTDKAIDFIEAEFKALGVSYTRTVKGSIYATLPGADATKSRVLSAHTDTLGAMVREIKRDGQLKLINIGGFPMNNIEGENLTLITREGKQITGTGLPTKASVHVFDDVGKQERSIDEFEMRLDILTSSKEDTKKAGINVGDFVVFDPRTVETETGFLKSRFLDDKLGVAILMACVKEFAQKKCAYTTHFFISTYEEVGHGLHAIPDDAFELIAVDIGTVGGGQASTEQAVTIMAKDGATPYHYGLRKKLEDLAGKNGINYETDVMFHYGSDASAFVHSGCDLRFGGIGPGVHATHHYERTHLDAIENTLKLVEAYIMEK